MQLIDSPVQIHVHGEIKGRMRRWLFQLCSYMRKMTEPAVLRHETSQNRKHYCDVYVFFSTEEAHSQ